MTALTRRLRVFSSQLTSGEGIFAILSIELDDLCNAAYRAFVECLDEFRDANVLKVPISTVVSRVLELVGCYSDVHAIGSIVAGRVETSLSSIGYFTGQPWLLRLETVSSYSVT